MAQHSLYRTCTRLLSRDPHNIGVRAYIALQASTHGEPAEVLRIQELELPTPKAGEVVVDVLGAPVNPADINQIQGVYPLRPSLPMVGGNEGVFKVYLQHQQEGWNSWDLAVPLKPCLGTWRQRAVLRLEDLWRVPPGISVEAAATMSINPVTALCLLEDFVKLQPGDIVVQNGAAGSVGKAVIQIAFAMGLTTINVVRHRPPEEYDRLRQELGEIGAHYLVQEEVMQDQAKRRELLNSAFLAGRPVRLALNCVGGESAAALVACLGPDAKLVTYGAMGRSAVQLSPAKQIFHGLSSHGFWLSGRTDVARKAAALQKVAWLIHSGRLRSRVTVLPLKDWKRAMHSWGRDEQGGKFLFKLT